MYVISQGICMPVWHLSGLRCIRLGQACHDILAETPGEASTSSDLQHSASSAVQTPVVHTARVLFTAVARLLRDLPLE